MIFRAFSKVVSRVWWAVALVALIGGRARGAEISDAELQNKRCFTCHAQSHIGEMSPPERQQMVAATTGATEKAGARAELYVAENRLARSVHGKVACVSCHTDAKTLPHGQKMAVASCDVKCHPAQ